MKRKWLYLGLTLPGVIVPWCCLSDFVCGGGGSIPLFFSSLFANSVVSAVAMDLLLSAVVFSLFVCIEGRRLAMRRLWLYPLLTFAIGLSFGLPLFLYARERDIERQSGDIS